MLRFGALIKGSIVVASYSIRAEKEDYSTIILRLAKEEMPTGVTYLRKIGGRYFFIRKSEQKGVERVAIAMSSKNDMALCEKFLMDLDKYYIEVENDPEARGSKNIILSRKIRSLVVLSSLINLRNQ